MQDIHSKIDDFVSLIKSRPCYEELLKQNEIMETSEEVIKLSNAFLDAQLLYSDGLKYYAEDSLELKKIYLKMRDAKMALDSNPIVKRYYELLSEYNEPLNYVQFKMLSLFKLKQNHNCR